VQLSQKLKFYFSLAHLGFIVATRGYLALSWQYMWVWTTCQVSFLILRRTSQSSFCFCEILSGDGDR